MDIFPEFTGDFDFWILLRLVAAAILGGIIGFERSGNRHEAGLRTHIIVCLGAAAVMIIGELICLRYGGDPARMSAQVISGIGFLGAGSIIMDGSRIRGITTAAGIWTTACVGIVVGAGYYIIAIFIVALMMAAMLGLRSLGKKIQDRSHRHTIKIEFSNRDSVKTVLNMLLNENADIKAVKFDNENNSDTYIVFIEFSISQSVNVDKLVVDIITMDTVISASPYTEY